MDWASFVRAKKAGSREDAGIACPGPTPVFQNLTDEYRAIGDSVAIIDRSYRALLEVRGGDRASWLHNLTTNDINKLSANEVVYAFVTDVQGRILFDVIVAVRDASIWLDLDRSFVDTALGHFRKYTIAEDVTVAERSADFVRIGITGPAAPDVLAAMDAQRAEWMQGLGATEIVWEGRHVPMIRHDFCGPLGVDLFVAPGDAEALWAWFTQTSPVPATPAGSAAVQVRRIEAGIPWPQHETTHDVLPAETGQFDRAVSFTKGCYLGQEIIERMRSRGVVARRLCGVVLAADTKPTVPCVLTTVDGERVGSLTSCCRSIALDKSIGLAYVKTAAAEPGGRIRVQWSDGDWRAEIVPLPFDVPA